MNVIIKDKNPIKLLTEKKYLDENINIQAETEELDITPTTESQVQEGLFSKVTVKGTERFIVRVVDYDGAILKEEELSVGETFELPEPPTHEGLIFDGWVSPVPIVDNTVLVENQDIIIGPMYYTSSGATELYIELNKKSTLTVTLSGRSPKFDYIDWGDGTIDTSAVHTYSEYGEYCIKIHGMTKIPMYWSSTTDKNNLKYCLKHLRISSTVTEFDTNCFSNLVLLETVTMSKNVKTISYYNFSSNASLKALVVPPNVKEVQGLVSDDLALTALVLPYGLKTIKTYLCNNCYSLPYLSLPDTIEEIGVGLLRYTHKVKRLHLPKSLKKVDGTFQNISSLEKIDGILPDNTDCNYDSMFSSSILKTIPIPKNAKSLSSYCSNTRIKSIRFPEGVETINSACSSCVYLEEAYVPDSVKILSSTFQNCYMLNNVRLPVYLEEIKGGCFWECYQLEELIMPPTLLALKDSCLYNTKALRKIDFSQHTFVPILGQKQSGINETCQIIVPDELYDEWIAATNWSAHADMIVKKSEVIDYDS